MCDKPRTGEGPSPQVASGRDKNNFVGSYFLYPSKEASVAKQIVKLLASPRTLRAIKKLEASPGGVGPMELGYLKQLAAKKPGGVVMRTADDGFSPSSYFDPSGFRGFSYAVPGVKQKWGDGPSTATNWLQRIGREHFDFLKMPSLPAFNPYAPPKTRAAIPANYLGRNKLPPELFQTRFQAFLNALSRR